MGRIICELEMIYGVRQGSAGKSEVPMELGKTQEELAEKLGIDLNTYKRSKKILDLIPELQDMVDSGNLITSVASRVLARLSPMQRVAVTEKYRPMFEKKAKENMATSTGGSSPQLSANLPKAEQKVDTRKELSKLAGVGERTYGKAASILNFTAEL